MLTPSSALDSAALAALADRSAYPDDPSAADGVKRIDTHISHVFLTGSRVYKFRRPVKLGFLDFSDPGERAADCLREVALNRRLAPDVYLGVAQLTAEGGPLRVGPVGETLAEGGAEPCVVMRRLRDGRDLLSLLTAAKIESRHVDAIAATIATFHAAHRLPLAPALSAEQWLQNTTAPALANFEALLDGDASILPHAQVLEARDRARRFALTGAADFHRRGLGGALVDGHGDLHAEHVWFEGDDSPPLIVDCLEFRDDFRRIDAASDVAFLAMDLTYRGRADLAARFLRRYARDSGDFHLFSVIDYFLSYRALVRAKVSALVAGDASMPEARRQQAAASARRHLQLGLDALAPRAVGATVLVCGLIGSGKTTVAEAVADAVGGVVISSDRVRKTRAGLAADRSLRAERGRGAYETARREEIYRALLEEADAVVRSGRTVILDATYGKRSWREEAADWARRQGSRAVLIEVRADEACTLARLRSRQAAAEDASDAGPELYAALRDEFEAPSKDWPSERYGLIDTSQQNWREGLPSLTASLAAFATVPLSEAERRA